MKLTIKVNEKITGARITPQINGENEVYAVEIDFDCSYLWSDLEFWLEDDSGERRDHAAMNVSKRNKMQFHK
jgi:hypothetical protein